MLGRLLFILLFSVRWEKVELFKWRTNGQSAVEEVPVLTNNDSYDSRDNRKYNSTITHELLEFLHERIPERVVHAKGAGAFGYFLVTNDTLSSICKAKLFSEVGKKTPIAVRFSTDSIGSSGIDVVRDGRGFAIKFYTEDGNFDIAGANTPVFAVNDLDMFHNFVHSLKPDPATNLIDFNMRWEYAINRPESLHFYLYIYSDLGIPAGFRFMPGYSVHTFQVVNEEGEFNFVRFCFSPKEGIKNLRSNEARRIAAYDPDYLVRDLNNAIKSGMFPSWKVFVQVLSIDDVKSSDIDPFDATIALPEDKYPLQEVGEIILNRNSRNFFSEIEQLAFCPGNLVPGVLGAPGRLYKARKFAYKETQRYRLGKNHDNLPINLPVNSQHHRREHGHHDQKTRHDFHKEYPKPLSNSHRGSAYGHYVMKLCSLM